MRRSFVVTLAAVLALVAVSACGAGQGGSDGPLKVGVNPVPHGEILNYIKENLAEKEDLQLEAVEFTDYVQPNSALKDGEIDANFFQHVPYLDEEKESKGYKFTPLKPVHIEPLGIYSKKVDKLSGISGGVVAIPNDPSNSGRALKLLADNDLITLKDGVGTNATEQDITANPKKLRFKPMEAAQLPRSLDDTEFSVINGNYAVETGLKPAKDALALEEATDNPYANVLVVRTEDKDDPRVQKLEKLLHSPEVKKYMEDNYDGSVLPAF